MKTKTQDYDKDHKAVEEAVKKYASSFSSFLPKKEKEEAYFFSASSTAL